MPFRSKKIEKYLTKSELDAINKLYDHLKNAWPEAKFKLFGSKATGKFDEESDIDILILLPCNVSEKIREQIIDIVFEINLKFDSNICPLILSKKEWADLSVLPIHYFVEKEGVSL
jgi:predicted nucleotidyltransferase